MSSGCLARGEQRRGSCRSRRASRSTRGGLHEATNPQTYTFTYAVVERVIACVSAKTQELYVSARAITQYHRRP